MVVNSVEITERSLRLQTNEIPFWPTLESEGPFAKLLTETMDLVRLQEVRWKFEGGKAMTTKRGPRFTLTMQDIVVGKAEGLSWVFLKVAAKRPTRE